MKPEVHRELADYYTQLLDQPHESLMEEFFKERLMFHAGQLVVHSDEIPKQ